MLRVSNKKLSANMQLAFIFSIIAGALYFGFAKRCFDLFSAAFAGCVLYFMPGIFGYGTYHIQSIWVEVALVPRTYVVMLIVTWSIIAFAVLYDVIDRGRIQRTSRNEKSTLELSVLSAVALLGLIIMLATSGGAVFSENKQYMLDSLNRWYILFITCTQIGFCLAMLSKQKAWAILFSAFLIFDVYIGFRSSTAMAVGGVIIARLHAKGPTRILIQHKRAILASVVGVIFIIVAKGYMGHIKAGNWDFLISERLNWASIIVPIKHNEAFIISSTLNEIMKGGVSWDTTNYFFRAGMALFPFGNTLAGDLPKFEFQDTLFSGVDYGMASTVWGESWAAGGWLLLGLIALLYCFVLVLFNRITFRLSAPFKAATLVAVSYWCLYIYRNSMEYQLVLEKRLLTIAIALFALRALLLHVRSTSGRSTASSTRRWS